MRFVETLTWVKDVLFPVACLGCGREGEWVCTSCASDIERSGVFCCPVCHAPQAGGVCCDACRSESFLTSHVAMTPYQEHSLIGRAVHALKYQYVEDIVASLCPLLADFLQSNAVLFEQIDVVIPVPLHTRRFAERGFNQAELLALAVGGILNKPVEKWVERTRYTPHQALLARLARLQNVADAFAVAKGVSVDGKRILLVDDVFTTGSTLQECAKALRNGGAGDTRGFSLARG